MTIKEIKWNELSAVELSTKSIKMIAISQFGPRIAFFGLKNGRNMLYWDPYNLKRKDWNLHGGHRTWPSRPNADESEENYFPDNNKCEIKINKDSFEILSPIFPLNGTRRGIRVTAINDTMLEVDNFIINSSDLLYSCGVWSLSCTLPEKETKYIFPIGEDNPWNSFSMVMFKNWGGHNGIWQDKQINYYDDLMIIAPQGIENKRMFQSHCGIGAMINEKEKITFAKKVSEYDYSGKYPMNCNWAFYIGPDNYMIEMETMGVEKLLKPGEKHHSIEKWLLLPEAVKYTKVSKLFD